MVVSASRAYVGDNREIPDMERPWIPRMSDHRMHLIRAERARVDAEIGRAEAALQA